jgi:lipopolysaccharide export system ATP-binding protein
LVDIFSYFRRRRSSAPRQPIAADAEAIDLASMGGVINGTYLDIASLPVAEVKARTERSPRPQRRPPAERVPQRQPPPESAPPPVARLRRRVDGNGAAPADRKGVLSVHGVEKSFVGRKVVKGVSLYVRKGEAVGLLGPNGAGKTTVFYMMTGLIKADKGRIELDGYNVTPLPMYQRARLGIGYLPQEASIFRGLNVEENIRAVLEVVEPDAKRRERDLNGLLEEFNIARLRKTPAIALSGGERRRVEIARSLATRHRRSDHRPQCTRDAGPDRSRLHYLFRRSVDGGPRRRHRQQP